MNRRQLIAAAPVMAFASAVPALAAVDDPMIGLCQQYIEAFKSWEAAAYEPGEGDLDGPLSTFFDGRKDRLEAEIKSTPVSSDAGFAAFCRFVRVDNYFRDESQDFPDMPHWQWAKIFEWAESRAREGS